MFLSGIGSSLSAFAFGVWVFQKTGSTTQFAVTTFAAVLPYALLAPIAGTFVDRWDRRSTMIGADSGQALVTAIIAWLLWHDQLAVWHLYIAAALSAIFGSFSGPAYSASTALLVPKEQLARVSGLGRFAWSGSRLLAPLLAGLLVVAIGLTGIVLIDLATFLIALVGYGLIQIPQPPRTQPTVTTPTFWQDLRFGWHYLLERPGLLGLVFMGGVLNLFNNIANTLQIPLVLSFADADAVGVVLTLSAGGSLVSGALMAAWGGPKRLLPGVMAFIAISGIGYTVAGLYPLVWLIAAGFSVASLAGTGWGMLMTALEQRKVALDVQGRVFGTEGMIALLFESAAYPLAGLLADQIFEPAMGDGEWLATVLGPFVGVGAGRGMGVQILLMGCFVICTASIGVLVPRIRHMEQELPDAVQ
ncbi:MAG: MFS transporter [Caldilineaceae bacterium]|nr:MFS transporter [Caldilineaceae bacterium]